MELDKTKRSVQWIADAPSKSNLATDLSEEELGRIGSDVVRSHEMDLRDREDWDKLSKKAMEMAQQVVKKKTFPWDNASNVKHPLITVASIQFAARAFPEIVKSGQVVKCQITGDEPRQVTAPEINQSLGQEMAGPGGMVPPGPQEPSVGPQSGQGGTPAGPQPSYGPSMEGGAVGMEQALTPSGPG